MMPGRQPMIDQAKILLKNVFGYDTFWPLQQEIIGQYGDWKQG
jgi:hypothetical protein